MDSFGTVRFAARRLLRDRVFTLASVLTLALGIGATTAIFSVASAVLLRPLPYPEADRLVLVGQRTADGDAGAGEPKFLFWRDKSRSFESLACYSSYGGARGNFAGGSEAEFVRGARVSQGFFATLGVFPVLGRGFTVEEDAPGAARVVVLSDGLWQRRFGADPKVIGRKVTLNDAPMTVVGVMPASFRDESAAELFLPMQARSNANYDPNATVVGRLKPGVSLNQAQAELKVIADQYRAALPKQMQPTETIGVKPYQDAFTGGGLARTLWILLGAVSFLLLIACANVAHLQLARAASREKEFAVRVALGGGLGQLARQMVVEGLLISVPAALLGTWLASLGTTLLVHAMPAGYLPNVAVVTFDWRVLALSAAAAILTGVLSGLAPLGQTRRIDVGATLKESAGRGATTRGRLRGALVVTELALSIALLAGVGLLVRSFANLLDVAPGFDATNVLTFQLTPAGERYKQNAQTAAFYDAAIERISSLPGVQSVAVTNKLPLDWQFNMPVFLSDKPEEFQSVQLRIVSPDFFRVMGIPVKSGRAFTIADNAATAPAMIVNEAFARRFLDGRLPSSRLVTVGRGLNESSREIVGVVGDIKQQGLNRPAPAMVFVPIAQASDWLMGVIRAFTQTHFVVRTASGMRSLVPQIRKQIDGIDPTLAISDIAPMGEIAARSVAPERFNMLLIGVFGAVAVLLSLIGVYGVMSHTVTQQYREIGVRVALGADSGDVVGMVLKQGARLAATGALLGGVLFVSLSSVMEGLLYEVSARDPLVFLAALSVLFVTAFAASYLPARRAARIDPIEALRGE
ncbi:MAG: ABC transporter permease [Vicinamibacteria bacterium]